MKKQKRLPTKFCLRLSGVLLLFFFFWGCASMSRPEGTNVEVIRPSIPGNMMKSVDVAVYSGRVPLLRIADGQTLYGRLEEGTFILTAVSPDPYRISELSSRFWRSQPFELVVEKDRFYKLEIIPATGSSGWEIRRLKE